MTTCYFYVINFIFSEYVDDLILSFKVDTIAKIFLKTIPLLFSLIFHFILLLKVDAE